MTLQVIGAGFGRTGTYSLKLALEELGLGPCHHMREVFDDAERQIPLWNDALAGAPDYDAIFDGYLSAVDWPVAAFWPEALAAYPGAKLILSTRSAESWYASFSQTILASLIDTDSWTDPVRPWLTMVSKVVIGRSLGGRTDRDGVIAAFSANEAAAKAAAPPERLLVFRAEDGWAPLCSFLGMPVPETPYPRSNSAEQFAERMKARREG